MKKIIPIIVIGVLLLSGIGAVAITEVDEKISKYNNFVLSEPIFEEIDDYINVNLKEATSTNMETGKPMLPVVTKVYTYPLGTIVNDVEVEFSGTKEYVLSKKIMPAPEPIPLLPTVSKQVSEDVLDETIYLSNSLYPEKRYTVRQAVGLDGEEIVLYLTVRCYPIQYSPTKDTIYSSEKIDVKVEYQPPKSPVIFPDVYDMVIITAEEYQAKAQELADHKNTVGVETTVKTVESILSDSKYSSGRDDPEKIKLFIKDAIEEWGIHYVLLFGGRKGQTFKWYIPERRTNNRDPDHESGYSSDLYYADIYKWNNDTKEWEFDDWDSNENDIFAEFKGFFIKDIMDYIPDVMIGRIPVRSLKDAKVIVDKIIKYETTTLGSWFNNAYVISGDSVPPVRNPQAKPGFYEGEIVTNITATYLESIGFTVDRLWTSNEKFAGREDVRQAFKDGAGFIHMKGHGNPPKWGEFLPEATSEEQMIDGLLRKDVAKLKNGDMLPIVVVGGCHNAQFNVTFANIIKGILKNGFYWYFQYWEPSGYGDFWLREWVFSDLCSCLLLTEGGGSIATLGNTGLGIGRVDEYCVEALEGWINIRFFDAYANQSKEILGDAHGQSITDYVNILGIIGDPFSEHAHRKTIEEFVLLGDPSLKIGGY